MARQRRDVWVCDAPGCTFTTPAQEDAPRGFSGKVSGEGGCYPPNVPWFACTPEHLQDAIESVMRTAHARLWSTYTVTSRKRTVTRYPPTKGTEMPKLSVEQMILFGVNDPAEKVYIDDGDDDGNHEAAGTLGGELDADGVVLTLEYDPFDDAQAIAPTVVKFIELGALTAFLSAEGMSDVAQELRSIAGITDENL